MAVTSMSRSSIGDFAKNNRVSNPAPETPWAKISTTPTGTFNDGTYDWNYWIYKSNGTLTVSSGGRVDYVVVAGGGTGNADNARQNVGGGGAGGVIESPEYARIDADSYAITVGSGGAATTSIGVSNDGNNSSIGSLAVAVGGGGGASRTSNGKDGGCGGGTGDGYQVQPRGGDPTFGQGFRGGLTGGFNSSAGGGGAGQAGSAPNGGNGRTTTIITTAIATSESVGEVASGTLYFAGGGGGGYSGAGGLGGGGDGSPADQRGVDCPANTGGGSGNSDTNQGSPYAGAGGSGVVIVRTRA